MSLQAPSALAIDARGLRFGIAAARFNAGYVDALLERHRGRDGRGGAGDAGQGAVPQSLHEGATVLGDHVADEPVEAPAQLLGGVLAE